MATHFELIEKEEIAELSFPKVEVLNNATEIKQRFLDLSRALSLGNLEHSKIKIYFEDSIGLGGRIPRYRAHLERVRVQDPDFLGTWTFGSGSLPRPGEDPEHC